MKSLRPLGFIGFVALLFIALAWPARAGLIHNLSAGFGSGQITFLNENGIDSSGVAAFSFNVPGLGGGITYGLAEIDSITWQIDPGDWSLTFSLETTFLQFNADSFAAVGLSSPSVPHNFDCPNIAAGGGANGAALLTCSNSGGVGATGGVLQVEAVEVPEPGAFAMFFVALGALSLAARRRQPA